jgi:hypothetical protein
MAKADVRTIGAAFICGLLMACASTHSAHQNFKNILNATVGQYADSPSVRGARNPETRIAAVTLPSGNVEEGYGLNQGACRYYFEIDKTTGRIVGWRYEGAEENCTVFP